MLFLSLVFLLVVKTNTAPQLLLLKGRPLPESCLGHKGIIVQ